MSESTVRCAGPDDRSEIAAVLAAAFASDPITKWILDGRRHPERDLRVMFGAIVREALKQGGHHVYVTNDGDAAAIWADVDRWKMSALTMLRLVPAGLRTGFVRTRAVKLNAAIQRAHPRSPHYYLEMIGTRPDRQGKGVGSMLLAALVEHSDADGVGTYLESSNPNNLAFYGRHGFDPQPAYALPKGCPPHTPMWRDPRTPSY
jgi:ribosomal protein S18 acetylase RimI-like enzyme